jgi:RHS repeat-associated protein
LSSKTETGIGALWPASSTLTWGCLQFYAGTASDELEARYYNNNFGRFWSPDRKGLKAAKRRNPTSWNRYLYAMDDPVNFRDPSGLEVVAPQGGGCLADDDDAGDDGDSGDDSGSGYDRVLCGVDDSGEGGTGSDGVTPAPPAPTDQWGPVQVFGPPPTTSQLNTLQAAYNQALNLINSIPQCGQLFSGDASGLPASLGPSATLEGTQFEFTSVDLGTAATQPGDLVQINPSGLFFQQPNAPISSPGNVGIKVPSPTTGVGVQVYLSPSDLGALILLHELGHEMGVFGPDADDPAANGQHSWDVLEDCFGMQAPQ